MINKSRDESATITGILFDKDGTLIDFNQTWLPLYRQAARYLAVEAGKESEARALLVSGGFIEADESWQPDSLLASGSNRQIYRAWAAQLGIEINDEQMAECYRIFSQKHNQYAAVVDPLAPFLSKLRATEVKIGVATMDDEHSAIDTLQGLGCSDLVDFVCGADSGYGEKPEPGMVMAFCQQCGLRNNEIMMVGDSPRDLKMGRNAKVGLSVGVLTGTTQREALAPFADHVLDDISGIPALLANKPISNDTSS